VRCTAMCPHVLRACNCASGMQGWCTQDYERATSPLAESWESTVACEPSTGAAAGQATCKHTSEREGHRCIGARHGACSCSYPCPPPSGSRLRVLQGMHLAWRAGKPDQICIASQKPWSEAGVVFTSSQSRTRPRFADHVESEASDPCDRLPVAPLRQGEIVDASTHQEWPRRSALSVEVCVVPSEIR